MLEKYGIYSALSFSLPRLVMIWGLFFLICFSLGYPTLNRYAPDISANPVEYPYSSLADTAYYSSLVKNGFLEMPDTHWRYRVLVPYVAKPFYLLFKGNIGSWNPIFFSLLIANSLFVASAALLLFLIGSMVTGSRTTGLVSSFLCLSHFNISNLYLAGLVDSSELFVIILTIWFLLQKKWGALPLIGMLAFLARETTVIFSASLSAGWFLIEVMKGEFRRSEIYAIVSYGLTAVVLGLGGLMLLRYVGTSIIIFPWQFSLASGSQGLSSVSAGFSALITSKALFYSHVWLLPLGLLGLRSIPKSWLWATLLTACVAFGLILIMQAGENAGRPLFNVAGPMLLVAAASYITKVLNLDGPPR